MNTGRRILSLLLAAVLLLALCACGAETDGGGTAAETRTVTDMLGREVEIPAKVERIVPLGNVPRMAAYLGLMDKIVGYSGMPPEKASPFCPYVYALREDWAALPIVGTDAAGQTDYYPEQIISVKPDVILCTSPAEMAEDLQKQTGVPVVAIAQTDLFSEEFNDGLLLIGDVCGASDRAKEVVDYIHACLSDLAERTKDIPEESRQPVLSAAATFKGSHGLEGVRVKDPVMDAVGARNIAAGASDQGSAAILDLEQILGWDPPYIFLDASGVPLVLQDAKEHPDYYAKLTAFREGHVYQYPNTTFYYHNLEVPIANCYFVGSILYPEQFADIEVRDKANEIFEFFLGAEDYMTVLENAGSGFSEVTLEK